MSHTKHLAVVLSLVLSFAASAQVDAGTPAATPSAPTSQPASYVSPITVYLKQGNVNYCISSIYSPFDARPLERFCKESATTYTYLSSSAPAVLGDDAIVVKSLAPNEDGATRPITPAWLSIRAFIGHAAEDSVSEHEVPSYSKVVDGKIVPDTFSQSALTIPVREFAKFMKYYDRLRISVTVLGTGTDGKPKELDRADFILSYQEEPRTAFTNGALDLGALFPVYSNHGQVVLSANPALMYKIKLGVTGEWRRLSLGLIPATSYSYAVPTPGSDAATTKAAYAFGGMFSGYGAMLALLAGVRGDGMWDLSVSVGLSVIDLINTINTKIDENVARSHAETVFRDGTPMRSFMLAR